MKERERYYRPTALQIERPTFKGKNIDRLRSRMRLLDDSSALMVP
jgi:hypothetical protein